MVKPVPIPEMTVRYAGLFDFDGVYAAVIDWAKNYGYLWREERYKHKVPTLAGAEIQLDWAMSKEINEYYGYDFKLAVHTWDMVEVEVEIGDKKKILSKGIIEIKITASVTRDIQKIFSQNAFTRKLSEWYGQLFEKELSSVYWDTLNYRAQNLQSIIKNYFDMQSKKYAYKGYLGEH